MEDNKERFDKILPPRIEDAGLEDCALPPDLINEAFLKAAAARASEYSPGHDLPQSRAAEISGVEVDKEEKSRGKEVAKEK